eukprot:c3224_g1_i1 orf=110-283(+)
MRFLWLESKCIPYCDLQKATIASCETKALPPIKPVNHAHSLHHTTTSSAGSIAACLH